MAQPCEGLHLKELAALCALFQCGVPLLCWELWGRGDGPGEGMGFSAPYAVLGAPCVQLSFELRAPEKTNTAQRSLAARKRKPRG